MSSFTVLKNKIKIELNIIKIHLLFYKDMLKYLKIALIVHSHQSETEDEMPAGRLKTWGLRKRSDLIWYKIS